MSDFNSSLPIRTENNGDAAVKVVDGTITSQVLGVDSSGRVTVKLNDGAGNSLSSTGGDLDVNVTNTVTVSATNLDIRDLSAAQDNVAISDGTDTLAVNADGSINSVVTATNLDIRDLTHVSDSVKLGDGTDFVAVNADGSLNITDNSGSLTVDATDLDIRDLTAASDSVAAHIKDESGVAFSSSNPLPVVMVESEGSEVNDYSTAAAVAAGGTSNHDYTVTGGTTLLLTQINSSASGKAKIEVQIETGVATGSFNTRFVQFNSTANPNMEISLREPISVAAGVRVRIIRTNKDNQAQDLYSTISGHEVT